MSEKKIVLGTPDAKAKCLVCGVPDGAQHKMSCYPHDRRQAALRAADPQPELTDAELYREAARMGGRSLLNRAGRGPDYPVVHGCPHTPQCRGSAKWCAHLPGEHRISASDQPAPWTDDHHDAQAWLAENVGREFAMSAGNVDSLAQLLTKRASASASPPSCSACKDTGKFEAAHGGMSPCDRCERGNAGVWEALCVELRTRESRMSGILCDLRDVPSDPLEGLRVLAESHRKRSSNPQPVAVPWAKLWLDTHVGTSSPAAERALDLLVESRPGSAQTNTCATCQMPLHCPDRFRHWHEVKEAARCAGPTRCAKCGEADGHLSTCPYHGWETGEAGDNTAVPGLQPLKEKACSSSPSGTSSEASSSASASPPSSSSGSSGGAGPNARPVEFLTGMMEVPRVSREEALAWAVASPMPDPACDVCNGTAKVIHEGDDYECPECAGTGTEDPAWRAGLSSSPVRERARAWVREWWSGEVADDVANDLATFLDDTRNDAYWEAAAVASDMGCSHVARTIRALPFTSATPKEKP